MTEPVAFISHFRVREGRLDALQQLSHDVSERLRIEKPRTALFMACLDDAGGTVSFVHAFADAEAMDVHFEGADQRARVAYEYVEALGWEVYGRPSRQALEALQAAASASGVTLQVWPRLVDGFLRGKSA